MRRRLAKEQAQVIDVLDRLEALFQSEGGEGLHALAEGRAAFARMIREHFIFRDEIYRRLHPMCDPAVDAVIEESNSGMLSLGVAYRLHIEEWPVTAMAANWPGFLAAARALMDQVRRLIASDREKLFPLLGDLPDEFAMARKLDGGDPAIIAAHRALGMARSARRTA